MTRTSLIINSPYDEPEQHWTQDERGRVLQAVDGRRRAAYEIVDTRTNTRRVEELELVNRIRPRVEEWREAGYPGVTSVTRRLLEHWHDREARQLPFYFCQLDAIETLIWWVEGPPTFKQGISLPGDGGPWERICNKMATGTGKTTTMGLIITWQVLNALTYPKRKEFSAAIFGLRQVSPSKSVCRCSTPATIRTCMTSSACVPTTPCVTRSIKAQSW